MHTEELTILILFFACAGLFLTVPVADESNQQITTDVFESQTVVTENKNVSYANLSASDKN